jgi:superfamily II DNA or RNA helicase
MAAAAYDRSELIACLDAHTVAKGEAYVRAVSKLAWLPQGTLSGKVQGSETSPYAVAVDLGFEEGDLWIEGECSCPVGYNCKHVAAVLLAGAQLVPNPSAAGDRPAPAVRPEILQWLEGFRVRHREAPRRAGKPKATQSIAYVISPIHRSRPTVSLRKIRLAADGALQSIEEPWNNIETALVRPLKYVPDEDVAILRELWFGRAATEYVSFALHGAAGAAVLEKILATGRTLAGSDNGLTRSLRVLRRGSPRRGVLEWQSQPPEQLRCALVTEPAATLVFPTDPFWYVDEASGEAGPIEYPDPIGPIADLLSMPPISLDEATLVGGVLREIAPKLPLPPVHDDGGLRVIDVDPVPTLTFDSMPTCGFEPVSVANPLRELAMPSFDYAGLQVAASSPATLRRLADGEVVRIERRGELEKHRLQELRDAGLDQQLIQPAFRKEPLPEVTLGLKDESAWALFMQATLPRLRASGWRCVMNPAFRFNVVEIEHIEAAVTDAGDGWFDLDMGIRVEDRRVSLQPLLGELFRRDPRWLTGGLESIRDEEPIELNTDRGERVRLRAARLKPILRILIDLFDGEGGLRIRRWDAARLGALDDFSRWQFPGAESIRDLALRLREGEGLREVPAPRGLKAELRDYQRQGLDWLQFLREHDLAGVLADDMGLGKTIQVLAHLLVEKEAGRLDRPALIVMPTSLIHNWRAEIERFAPSLRVVDLYGAERRERFEEIARHDLVLTTYPLVWRDQAALALYDYHLLVLDESQFVKTAGTKTSTAIRSLRARHRLCLTGTPLENHLGELWAQFDFLLPGFLGSHKDFGHRWRTPIEKQGDGVRRDLLARRIRPFMLRRRKDEVAKELPPKTTIVRSVELDGAQRDLYETVRNAMQERVREAISAQGFARSHIVMLDALLKLRQVCCDPRLVQLGEAKHIRESAKLALLMEMLPALVEDGRRILLFSQFTSMLALIAAALEAAAIGYVTLTGETTDRATPIEAFMRGDAPVFLISLKAGGVGLNLTAADTVIHYDPWWNPAVENQATDRAHRLGQTKPVFVYKLVVAGSIEEKIVALQARKSALADSILSDDPAKIAKFSPQDLEALMAPLPGESAGT